MSWAAALKAIGKVAGSVATSGGSTLLDRLFAKRDRKIAWNESNRYGQRDMAWEKNMAEYNNQMSQQMSLFNQQMSKDFFDYTAAYESPENQLKLLKNAGLNPALMYSQGSATGNGGSTGGAEAQFSRANAPQEGFKGMGMPDAFNIRETPAERELKLAQAENLRTQSEQTKGVDTDLKRKQIESLDTGITNEKAKNALIKAQTLSQELANKLSRDTLEDQKDIVRWTSKQAAKQFEIAESEAYISKETRDTKIKLLNQELISSIIEAKLKEATIKHLGKQNDKIDSEIRNISLQSADIVIRRAFDTARLEIDKKKLSLEEIRTIIEQEKAGYRTLHEVGGKLVNESINSIYTLINSIFVPMGLEPGQWK